MAGATETAKASLAAHAWLGTPCPHRDPFDRMLVAQPTCEIMPLVSNDAVFREYVWPRCGETARYLSPRNHRAASTAP